MNRPVTRRTLVRGAAWSVPAVTMTAAVPAFAVSACRTTRVRFDWASGRYVRTSPTQGTYTIDPDGAGRLVPITLTIANSFLGSNTQLGSQIFNGNPKPDNNGCNCNENLATSTFVVGGTGETGLTLHQSPKVDSAKVATLGTVNKTITTFTFSKPVTNLTFSILDVDSLLCDFYDAVALTGTTATGTYNPTYMTGVGTVENPWRPVTNNLAVPDSSRITNVNVTMPSVTTFQLHYWNLSACAYYNVDGDQRIFLSDFNVTYDACPP